MDKTRCYLNIYELIENGYYLDEYTKLTMNYDLENDPDCIEFLEKKSSDIFNAILIGCQLFDDIDLVKEFVSVFKYSLDSSYLERHIEEFGITKDEAVERLKHGFGVHFTTPGIVEQIKSTGGIVEYGKNAMFTKEEDEIIKEASNKQREADPTSVDKMNYLSRGFGTGVSSYGSITNEFWMYHTPESLSFLFGNISERNKEKAMAHVARSISSLNDEDKVKTFNTMSEVYDRLIGDKESISCVLIDRDAFHYEKDYYYDTNPPREVERRPYANGLSSLEDNDKKIDTAIPLNKLKFIELPTIKGLEKKKKELLSNNKTNTNINKK